MVGDPETVARAVHSAKLAGNGYFFQLFSALRTPKSWPVRNAAMRPNAHSQSPATLLPVPNQYLRASAGSKSSPRRCIL